MNKVLASNQTIISTYYNILRNLVFDYREAINENEKKEKALLVVIMSVTIIEAFLNIYFLLLVSEEKYSQHCEQISREISNTSDSLDKKIKNWPMLLFKKRLDLGKGVGQKFQNLKTLRNKLLHFQSDHNELVVENIRISKLLEITVYEQLVEYDVESCQTIVLDFASEIFRLVGIQENKIGTLIQLWFGDLTRR